MEIGIILTIIFVVLRLTGVIHWSWWWVLAPLWIGAIIIGIMLGAGALACLFIMRRLLKRMRTFSHKWWGTSGEVEKTLPESKTEYHDEE